jgi:hypothetical protein
MCAGRNVDCSLETPPSELGRPPCLQCWAAHERELCARRAAAHRAARTRYRVNLALDMARAATLLAQPASAPRPRETRCGLVTLVPASHPICAERVCYAAADLLGPAATAMCVPDVVAVLPRRLSPAEVRAMNKPIGDSVTVGQLELRHEEHGHEIRGRCKSWDWRQIAERRVAAGLPARDLEAQVGSSGHRPYCALLQVPRPTVRVGN